MALDGLNFQKPSTGRERSFSGGDMGEEYSGAVNGAVLRTGIGTFDPESAPKIVAP